jgi:hypothetical protein
MGQVDMLPVGATSDAVHDDADADGAGLEGADVTPDDGTPVSEQVVQLARVTGAHFLHRGFGPAS